MNLFLTDNIPTSVIRTESEKHIIIIKKLQENKPYETWKYLILPSLRLSWEKSFHEIYSLENGLSYETPEEQKAVAKSEGYIQFINDKIEKSQRLLLK
jgi:ABC-type transport system involved in cytochrome bd biosynthesis fused ATPase/permease subunit